MSSSTFRYLSYANVSSARGFVLSGRMNWIIISTATTAKPIHLSFFFTRTFLPVLLAAFREKRETLGCGDLLIRSPAHE